MQDAPVSVKDLISKLRRLPPGSIGREACAALLKKDPEKPYALERSLIHGLLSTGQSNDIGEDEVDIYQWVLNRPQHEPDAKKEFLELQRDLATTWMKKLGADTDMVIMVSSHQAFKDHYLNARKLRATITSYYGTPYAGIKTSGRKMLHAEAFKEFAVEAGRIEQEENIRDNGSRDFDLQRATIYLTRVEESLKEYLAGKSQGMAKTT